MEVNVAVTVRLVSRQALRGWGCETALAGLLDPFARVRLPTSLLEALMRDFWRNSPAKHCVAFGSPERNARFQLRNVA